MTLEVLIFGPAALAVGAGRVAVSLAPDASSSSADSPRTTAGAVLREVSAQHPGLAFALGRARLAVNRAIAAPDDPVRPGDELALIALVGGG